MRDAAALARRQGEFKLLDDGDDAEEEERMGWKADVDVDSSRQLSPVSVLDLHSDDEESPVHSHCKLSHSHLLPLRLIQFPLRS